MLYAVSLYLLLGRPVDWNQLKKRFKSHIPKLKNDVIGTFINTEMPKKIDRKGFLKKMLSGALGRNSWKNYSLYVGFDGNEFTLPSTLIKEQTATRTIELAVMTLEDNEQTLKAFSTLLTKNKEELREQLLRFPDINKLDNNEIFVLLVTLNELMSEAKLRLQSDLQI